MKRFWLLIRTTFVGGIFFLAPMVLLIIIVEKALMLIRRLVDPLVAVMPVENLPGLPTHRILGLTILGLICLAAGLLAKTKAARAFVGSIESSILSKIPGYAFYKQTGESLMGLEKDTSHPVVLALIDNAWQIAFLMESMENGMSAIFVPDAPTPWTGSVYFATPDCIKATSLTHAEALRILKKTGGGAKDLLKNYF